MGNFDSDSYAVYHSKQDITEAETDLSDVDVMEHISKNEGVVFELEEKIVSQFDNDDNDLPDAQEETEDGDLVYEVWQRNENEETRSKNSEDAIGPNKEEARENFLRKSFNDMWDSEDPLKWGKDWRVLTMQEYEEEVGKAD